MRQHRTYFMGLFAFLGLGQCACGYALDGFRGTFIGEKFGSLRSDSLTGLLFIRHVFTLLSRWGEIKIQHIVVSVNRKIFRNTICGMSAYERGRPQMY